MTSNNRKRDHEDITGRDAFVVAAALWTFIRYEQSAPIRERRWSDMLDAVTILKALYPGFIRVFELKDELKGLRPVELTRRNWKPWTQARFGWWPILSHHRNGRRHWA